MKDFEENIDCYIDQYNLEKNIFELKENITKRGWLKKDEFLAICLWKSRRPKRLYNQNSESSIKLKTRSALSSPEEKLKILFLTDLHGVSIPTASAILSVTNPDHYPIIDKRCILSLNYLGYIKWKTITESNWIDYLEVVRSIAKQKGKTARDVDKGLFAYNRIHLDNEYENLY